MKDSLKEFVAQNKQAFDAHQPADSSWKQIEMKLPEKRFRLWNSVILWRSAAILLMGISIFLFISKPVVKSSMGESAQLRGEFKVFTSDRRVISISRFFISSGSTGLNR